MQIIRYLILFTLLFCLVFGLACSHKNPAPIEEWDDQFPPTFVHKSIQIPEPLRLSPDSMAQVAVGYVDMFKEMEKFVPLLNPSADSSLPEYKLAGSGTPWVHSWKAKEGFLIILIITGDRNRYEWELKFWGQDTINNKYYDKWIFMKASNYFEGNHGSITRYQTNSKDSDSDYSWSIDPEATHYDDWFRILKSKDHKFGFLVEMTLSYDFSGELLKYSLGEEQIYNEFKFSWNAFGKGEWWRYNENNEVIASGSW